MLISSHLSRLQQKTSYKISNVKRHIDTLSILGVLLNDRNEFAIKKIHISTLIGVFALTEAIFVSWFDGKKFGSFGFLKIV